MKRGAPLKRTTPLKADPEATRVFVQRGRGKLNRRDWRARNPPPRKTSLPGARGWTQRVFTLYGNRCVVCGERAVQGHHAVERSVILSARHLTQTEREALAYDARNGVPVCLRDHERHTNAVARIPFACLPPAVVEWALAHGFRGRIMDRRIYPRGSA